MWQIRPQAGSGSLVPHIQDGTFSVLSQVTNIPELALSTGSNTAQIKITVAGNQITTWVNDIQRDTRTLTNFSSGTIGVRTDGAESSQFTDLRVVSATGQVLFWNDFATTTNPLPCGNVASNPGFLTVSGTTSCVLGAPTAPGAVPKPTVIAGTPAGSTAVVNWTSPYVNGSPVTSYQVTLGGQTQTVTPPTQGVTFTGLAAGTYTATVVAVSAAGSSTSVASDPFVAAGSSTVPAAPAKPTATAGPGSIAVSWTPPANGGSAITGYKVYAIPASGPTIQQNVAASATSVTVNVPAGTYTVKVRATNVNGDSPDSPPSDPVVVTAATPTTLTVTGDFAFGSVPVGSTSATRTVTLTNNTASTIYFTGTSGRSGPVFNMVPTSDMCNWGSVLAPGQSCTAALRANPSVTGLTTGEFVATFQNGVPDVVVPESVTGT
jgi:hypothetical protein